MSRIVRARTGTAPHTAGSTGLVKDGVCDLIAVLYPPFSRVLSWVMRRSSGGGDVALVHDL